MRPSECDGNDIKDALASYLRAKGRGVPIGASFEEDELQIALFSMWFEDSARRTVERGGDHRGRGASKKPGPANGFRVSLGSMILGGKNPEEYVRRICSDSSYRLKQMKEGKDVMGSFEILVSRFPGLFPPGDPIHDDIRRNLGGE